MSPPPRPTVWLAACCPVDTSKIQHLFEAAGYPNYSGMQDDEVKQCESCAQDIWVAPKKRLLASLGHAVLMCYVCAISTQHAASTVTGQPMTMTNLDPNRVERPR